MDAFEWADETRRMHVEGDLKPDDDYDDDEEAYSVWDDPDIERDERDGY